MSSTRTYSTSLWVELPPSIRPDTEDDTLPPTPPTPPNISLKCPDQYGSAMKPIHTVTRTPNRTGSPRSSLRPIRTSTVSTPSITNGVSWWAGTLAANRPITTISSTARCRRLVGSTSISPGRRFVQITPGARNQTSSTATKTR